jgi:serine O-acetyltransferase
VPARQDDRSRSPQPHVVELLQAGRSGVGGLDLSNAGLGELCYKIRLMGAVDPTRKRAYKRGLLTSRRLWLLSIDLQKRGHPRLANGVRNFNSLLYNNSLPVDAKVSPDVHLAHHAMGTVIHRKTVIGKGVTICQNVTMAVRPSWGAPHGIVIDDHVFVGANSVIITSRTQGIRIGRGARIGAGALVTRDIPVGATVTAEPSRIRLREE